MCPNVAEEDNAVAVLEPVPSWTKMRLRLQVVQFLQKRNIRLESNGSELLEHSNSVHGSQREGSEKRKRKERSGVGVLFLNEKKRWGSRRSAIKRGTHSS